MKKFVCPVCGYVHEAEEMAADFRCPLCRVPGSKFKVMEEGKLAAVQLDHKFCPETIKICDIFIDTFLPLKPNRVIFQKAIP